MKGGLGVGMGERMVFIASNIGFPSYITHFEDLLDMLDSSVFDVLHSCLNNLGDLTYRARAST